MTFDEGLIKAIAIQLFLNRNRNVDFVEQTNVTLNYELDQKWREDIVVWNTMSNEQKQEYLESARIYMTDWVTRYPRYASAVLNDWQEVDFNNL